ncbi:type VI secretion system-associated FHA domain protein TagH [Pseudomonas sp. D1-1]|uniref:type VI secretion system-associated FHA domain protein TagH n=1 Tax=Pseudomonas sp. D1-1 TaxID=1040793 RepID=UPI003DA91D2C
MELVLEMLTARQFITPDLCRKIFGPSGGVIGRGDDCDWIIPDCERLLSKRHARVSFEEGRFFLTDTSGNGISHRKSGMRLPKGQPVHIEDGDVYVMGDCTVQARLVEGAASRVADRCRSVPVDGFIPDDAFFNLDPLKTLVQQERAYCGIDELINPGAAATFGSSCPDHGRVDTESLLLPELVEAPREPELHLSSEPAALVSQDFWRRFGVALGMDLDNLDNEGREALAIDVARLFQQSIRGLQQSVRTRRELKSELRLAPTQIQRDQKNPLKYTDDALQMLLQPRSPGMLSATDAIASAFSDLQAHQVALLAASRATLRATLEHFSPRQLILRLEREQRLLISTHGRYWRAYGRYHQALCLDDDWTERLLARDFAKAYEEQVRLISTLQNDSHG